MNLKTYLYFLNFFVNSTFKKCLQSQNTFVNSKNIMNFKNVPNINFVQGFENKCEFIKYS